MDKDTNKTKVIFRKFSDGDIIALFPEIAADQNCYNCQSYMHIGHHGAASIDLVYRTKPASETEYKDLFQELESIGYNLQVIKKIQHKTLEMRRKQIKG